MKHESVLIVGVGGLGVPAAIAVARAGVGRVGLIDPDPIELSNLARQVIYGSAEIGMPKVSVAARRLARDFPKLEVDAHRCELEGGNAAALIGAYDFVIDATDHPAAKFLINDVCIALDRPFSYGGVLGFAGQAMTVIPHRSACLRCLFEEPPNADEIASCRDAGIIGPVAGAIGEVQAGEAIAWLRKRTCALAGSILTYDGAAAKLRVTAVRPRAGCRCGAARESASARDAHG